MLDNLSENDKPISEPMHDWETIDKKTYHSQFFSHGLSSYLKQQMVPKYGKLVCNTKKIAE